MGDKHAVVPTWDGNPSTFETYVTAARWFERGTKQSERSLVVARLWGQLTGAAKSVVRYLEPEQYEGENGLKAFLDVLRSSPLQQLPVPDSFNRLERWHNLKRHDRESIPELIVREEELFTSLQQALLRARKDRSGVSAEASPSMREPPQTPSRSPTTAAVRPDAPRSMYPQLPVPNNTHDFFEDELRGYRLLRASRISSHEKQNVLVQTGNSTSFVLIRRALRTLFADEPDRSQSKGGRIWYEDAGDADWYADDWNEDAWWVEDADWSPSAEAYWSYDDQWEEWQSAVPEDESYDMLPDEQSADPTEVQLVEAYNISAEAHKTLKDAREAVRKVRQSRGYFAPESNSGKGMVPPTASSSPTSSGSGKGASKGQGACFRCGLTGHGYQNCPDRFAGGKFKGKPKGKPSYGKGFKGKSFKGKFSGKGKTYFMDLSCIMSAWDGDAVHSRTATRAIIDTGASENAIGIDCLQDLVRGGRFLYAVDCNDLPTFRFGNGQKDRAVSHVQLFGTSLGDISFYVLSGTAHKTPPLIGARTLRGKRVNLSYEDGLFRYREPNANEMTVKMQALTSGHLTIDLSEVPKNANSISYAVSQAPSDDTFFTVQSTATAVDGLHQELHINMISNVADDDVLCNDDDAVHDSAELAGRLQLLASRLKSFHNVSGGNGERACCSSRLPPQQLPVLRQPQEREGALEQVGNMEQLRSLRPETSLCVQERCSWERSSICSREQPLESHSGGIGEDHSCCRVHGEASGWQDDGDQGQDAASRDDQPQVHAPDLCTVHGGNEKSWCCDHDSNNSQGIHTCSQDDNACANRTPGAGEPGASSSPECLGTTATASREFHSGSTACAQDDCSEIHGSSKAHDASPKRLSTSRGGGDDPSSASPREFGRGRADPEEKPSAQGLWSLWERLKLLRTSMAPGKEHTTIDTTTQGSPELVCGSQSLGNTTQPSDGFQMSDKAVNPLRQIHDKGSTTLAPPVFFEQGTNSKRADDDIKTQSKKNLIYPSLAKKLATSVAVLGAAVALPMQGLMAQLQDAPDFLEVACAPNSSLTSKMESMGFACKRYNFKSGFDLGTPTGTSMLQNDLKLHAPRFAWISLPCARISPLQNLCMRTEWEQSQFERRVNRDLKRADEVADGLCMALDKNPQMDFGWEWPTNAARGWKSRAIKRLLKKMEALHRPVFWCRFHGCAYGLEYKGIPVLKGWTVLTSNRKLWMSLQRKCPGHKEHCQCRGVAAQASAYYPDKMVHAVAHSIAGTWSEQDAKSNAALSNDIETYLLDLPVEVATDLPEELYVHDAKVQSEVRDESPDLFALSRTSYPQEPPTGRKLELIKQQMLRIHRASGHTSFSNLQRLLRARNAPAWSVELAGSLQCPACIESKRPLLHPPASTHDDPKLFEVVGTDIFEYEHGSKKHKLILWRDRASGYCITKHLQEYEGNWEPNTSIVINSFTQWLMVNPSPTWILTDSGVQYTSEEFQNFCLNSGIGLMTAPAEAHWILGAEEGTIGILKASVTKLLREEPELSIENAFALACHGANCTIGPSGFSAFQWVRGGATPQDPMLSGLDPRKAFGGLLHLKEKARIAFEQEHAKYKLSRLNNALGRSPSSFTPGALVMIWRQRMKPGKATGHWQGPVRVLLQEGSTLWLGSGATLIRAKTNQCRDCTKREELQASLEGVAILQQPVSLESLLKSFTGKHYRNITGEAPSSSQITEDFTPTDVRLLPDASRQQPDVRRGRRAPGPAQPARAKAKPKSAPKSMAAPASSVSVQDEPETPVPPQSQQQPQDSLDTPVPTLPEPPVPEPSLQQPEGRMIPGTPGPGTPRVNASGSGSQQCVATDCILPGGHAGPHKDEKAKTFSWNLQDGRIDLEGDDSDNDDSSSSSSSTTSEELKPDVPSPMQTGGERKRKEPEISDSFFVLEIEVPDEDAEYLFNHPRRAAIWLSRRMQEKGKEHLWQQLPLERKRDFDGAQAKELTNVLQSKALRSLTADETKNLDMKSVMKMRWVLTTKPSGDAKARLVILGFQQPNLVDVQAAAPTMNRMSRNILLMMCANNGFRVRAGDVTSAFLQTSQSMEDENLTVWATPELAVLFGAPPDKPWLPLRVSKAFYGLCHAPRAWYEDVAATLCKGGWRQMVSDKCLFTLWDNTSEEPRLVGMAGIHVDDFLIGGDETNEVFKAAMTKLENAYRWGKWSHQEFDFAGCHIRQENAPSSVIYIDQNEYSDKWMDEVQLSPERALQVKSPATPSEISQLRGVIGTLAWRSSQTSPHFQADVGLILSEIPFATVSTLIKANKLVREVRGTPQSLMFPQWNVPWKELAVVVWADASNSNRPDRSSTMGIVAGCAPLSFLDGEKHAVALLQWRSSKTPRQCLGSNGAEVQAITEGEDLCFRLRALLAEVNGETLTRRNISQIVKEKTHGALVMDSKGIYDSMSRNVSALHGLKSGRAGYELTLSVSQALEVHTKLRWVHGEAQLADALTKGGPAKKMMMRFFSEGQKWQLIHDPEFTAGKKVKKKELLEKMRRMEETFVLAVIQAAKMYRWPITSEADVSELRIMGDEISSDHWKNTYPHE